jgi:hypothetical protein
VHSPTKTPKASSLPHNVRNNPYYDMNLTPEGESQNINQQPLTSKYTTNLKRSSSLSEKFKELISPTLTKLRKRAGKSSESSDDSSGKQGDEEVPPESVIVSTSGNSNENLYSYPSMDLPTYLLVFPPGIPISNSVQIKIEEWEKQDALLTPQLENIVGLEDLNIILKINEDNYIAPVTLEISPNKKFLGINNSSGTSKLLENLPIEFPPEKHGSIANPNKILTTLSGTKKGKGKSTSSSSQSSSGQDSSDEGEEGSNPDSG